MGSVHSGDVIKALEHRYNPPSQPRQWGTFTEVPDGDQRRRVDWMAVHLWQSRGRVVHGVEVKVNRADWLRELRSPKADSWFGVCDAWYLAAPQGVVQEGELPATWGFYELLMTKNGWRVKEKVKAPQNPSPVPAPWWLVQRLVSRVEDVRRATPRELEEARSETYTRAYEAGKAAGAMLRVEEGSARRQLRELLDALGGASGSLAWMPDESRIDLVRRAVELLDSGRMNNMAKRSSELFREAADAIDRALAPDAV